MNSFMSMVAEDKARICYAMFRKSFAPVVVLLYMGIFTGRKGNDGKEEYSKATHSLVLSYGYGVILIEFY